MGVRFGSVIANVRGCAQTCFPPRNRHDLHRELERSPVQLLGELGDRNKSLGEALVVHVTRDLNSRVASSPLPAQLVLIA